MVCFSFIIYFFNVSFVFVWFGLGRLCVVVVGSPYLGALVTLVPRAVVCRGPAGSKYQLDVGTSLYLLG